MNFLTPEQIAQTLQITKMTVYREIKRGNLKAYKFGKELRIKNSDFEAYLHNAYHAAQQSMTSQRSCITPQPQKAAKTGKTAKKTAPKKVVTRKKPTKRSK